MKRYALVTLLSLFLVANFAASDLLSSVRMVFPLSKVEATSQPEPLLNASDPVQHLFWHPFVAVPPSIRSSSLSASEVGVPSDSPPDVKRTAVAFLRAYGAQVGAASVSTDWVPKRVEADVGDSHVFLSQFFEGVPVFGAEVAVHLDKTGAVTGANGQFLASGMVATKPSLSAEAAYKAAISKLAIAAPVMESAQLVVFNPGLLYLGSSDSHLAYDLVIGEDGSPNNQTVLIDSIDGKVLLQFDNLREGRTRDIRDLNGSTSAPGPPCYGESGPIGTPSEDCTNAFNFAGDTYGYYLNTHGRDGFDGHGATMLSSVQYGTMGNAYWDGAQTVFGPGFAAKDVVAHEWTHAVTQYTADLVYASQSGALNESISDIFGAMIDREDWLMGEDLPSGALRSLADPTIYGNPGKVSDSQYYCGAWDNGGVHTNSGVPNHTAFLMSEGGTYNGRTISGIGRDATERIFYRALTRYLTSGSGFADAYSALIASASDLYGTGSTLNNVTAAAQATEMNQQACGSGGTSPDAFEPDNLYGQASTIAVSGANQRHNFHTPGDNDWAKFSATAGTAYVVETRNLGADSDTYAYLYGTDGATVLAQDDDGGDGRASRIAWTASAAGVYFVRVRHYSGSARGAATSYDLAVTGVAGSPGADAFEPDDSPSQASTIVAGGSSQTHNFHQAGDNDWSRFAATAGNSYIIRTLDLSTANDTYLYLYGTDGSSALAQDDDSGGGRASRIDWVAPASGTFYLRVRHYSPASYGSNTNYRLSVAVGGTTSDSFEPDGNASQASTITVNGGAQTHNFNVADDNDWIEFAAVANTYYTIRTANLGANADTFLYLYDVDATTIIRQDDDGGGGLASRIVWTAPSSGVYYLRVRHYSSVTYGANTNYDLSVEGVSRCGDGDSYEPDDSSAEASTIVVNGAARSHNFYCAGDNDWVRFTATVGLDYVARTLDLGSNADTYLYLYATDGLTILASNDDGGGGLGSRIAWRASDNGTYFLRVRHYSSTAAGANTSYNLQVTATGSDGDADSYEDDDVPGRASALSSAQSNHNFHDAGDEDWARFSATAGNNYIVETINLGSRSDTYLYLYGVDGATVLRSDDDSGGGKASRIAWTAPSDGAYYVSVRQYASSIYGANSNYDLRVVSVGSGGADTYEPDDSATSASTIVANGNSQTHNFDVAGDTDWARFSATGATAYTIQTENLGSNSDTYLYVFDTDGASVIESNDDGGGGRSSRITWTPPSSGVYYAMVRHYNSSAHGSNTSYDLRLISSGGSGSDSFEPDDSASQASVISPNGASQTHNSHYAGDNDWARFTANAGYTYVIGTFDLARHADTYLNLYSSDGAIVISSDDDGGGGLASRITWTAPVDGTYYIRARQYRSGAYGDDTGYSLRVTNSGCGGGDVFEPDNSYSQASAITVNGSAQSHSFYCAGDNDWARFTATAGLDYVMETLNLGSDSDTYLYLYESDATTVLSSDDDSGDGYASRIAWTAPFDGTYYVRTRHYSSSASGANTNYDLQLTATGVAGADNYEPDNAYHEANNIDSDGTSQSHNFHEAGDADWARFYAESGSTCVVDTLNLGDASDTYLYLYGTDASTLLASNDDGGDGLASRVVRSMSASGTYYARVRHYSSSAYGPDTRYDLRVSCSGSGADLYEPDGSVAQASTITANGGSQRHNFHVAGDSDWARFAASAGTTYVLETLDLGSNSDTYMYLYDTDGSSLITWDDDSGPGVASRIVWAAPSSGAYYVRVRHYSNAAYGPDASYDLRVTSSASLTVPRSSVQLGSGSARANGVVEATVKLERPAAMVKVEVGAKASYLRLIEAVPLSTEGKPLGEQVIASPDRWQVSILEDGRASVLYDGKDDWNASGSYPILRLRWQLGPSARAGKLLLPLQVTVIDQNGSITTDSLKMVVEVGSEPKIDSVRPDSFVSGADIVLSVEGSNFSDAPKIYLHSGAQEIELADVSFIDSQHVYGTAQAGTKAGTYKVKLVSPDGSVAESAGDITVESQWRYSTTLTFPIRKDTASLGTGADRAQAEDAWTGLVNAFASLLGR